MNKKSTTTESHRFIVPLKSISAVIPKFNVKQDRRRVQDHKAAKAFLIPMCLNAADELRQLFLGDQLPSTQEF